MTTFTKSLFLSAGVCLLTVNLASAQTLAGTVRDTSGAVLPGVTVEASSPALIEKTRTAVTDGSGQYQITNLPPGTYTVTFSLQGFATVVREGVELTGGGVTTSTPNCGSARWRRASRSPEKRRSSTCSRPGSRPCSAATSCGRCRRREATATTWRPCPAIQATGFNTGVATNTNFFTARGGRANEGVMQIDGMNVGSPFNGGGVSELRVRHEQRDRSAGLDLRRPRRSRSRRARRSTSFPRPAATPSAATYFGSWAGQWGQSRNIDDELRALGLRRRAGAAEELGQQLLARRADQAQPDLVLRQHADHGQRTSTRRTSTRTRTRATPSRGPG